LPHQSRKIVRIPEQLSTALNVTIGLILEGRDAASGPALSRGVVADEHQGVLPAGDLRFERRSSHWLRA
jgi:hypothetical protein